MKKVFTCRRTVIALFAISCLTALGILVNAEVAGAIATVALAVAAANATQGVFTSDKNKADSQGD
jgi:low temperature requirement protein LtrA